MSQWYLGNCSFSVFRGLTCNLCLLGTRYWCSLNLRSQGSKAGALLSRCPIRSLRLYSGLCMYLCLYGCVRAHMFVRLPSVMLEYTWLFESFCFSGQSSLCSLDPNPQCPLMDRTMTLQVHTHLFVQLRSCRIHFQPLSSMGSATGTGPYWTAGTAERKIYSWLDLEQEKTRFPYLHSANSFVLHIFPNIKFKHCNI